MKIVKGMTYVSYDPIHKRHIFESSDGSERVEYSQCKHVVSEDTVYLCSADGLREKTPYTIKAENRRLSQA